jgi:PAS domain S-box-containing protein
MLGSFVGLRNNWRRARTHLSKALPVLKTERKRAEQSLQQNQFYLSEGQRLARMGSWAFDATGFCYWSPGLCQVHGFHPRREPPTIEEYLALVHPEDQPFMKQAIAKMLDGRCAFDFTKRIVLPDGETRSVRCVGVPATQGETFQGFLGTGIDVTEQERLAEELRLSEFYLSEGQRLAHMGSWAFNSSGHYWSDELYKIYGLDPKNGAPTVEQYLALIHPQDRASMAETIKRMQEEHCGFDQIERIIRPDGQLRHVRAVAVPVLEQGVFKGFIGTTMDVTEQELLTQELRRERAYLAEAQSLTHIGSWVTNFDTGEMLHLSDEVYRLHGFEPNQGPIPLERFWDTVHPDDEPVVRAAVKNAIRTRTDYDVPEFRVLRPDGSVRFLRTIGHQTASGEIGEYIGITMDVTERKRAEEERERLRQLEADLAHINRVNMMGELAAALAHEIKQPIAASITSANALLRWLAHDPPDLERARTAALRIEQDSNRAADVINSLRSFYRTGTPSERQVIDVKEIIGEMTVLLRIEADRHSVTIHPELEADTPKALANRVQLQQVFMNLMLNAIEAMKETGGELTIKSRGTPEGRLIVSISDNGVGLPAGRSEQIFDPFHTTKPQGTGMGLTITRSIVESYGGRVWATVNQDAGATFHFTLPGETEPHV